jgi:hypothetical protein
MRFVENGLEFYLVLARFVNTIVSFCTYRVDCTSGTPYGAGHAWCWDTGLVVGGLG